MPASRSRSEPKPETVRVRMFQVGFGDCFLVSFSYAKPLADKRSERHILIDFGSTHGPKGTRATKPSLIERVAAQIEKAVGKVLDVVVLTHRHRDHLSGFGDADSAAVVARLAPKLVVRPWTEHPDLPRDATAPLPATGDDQRLAFANHLAAGHQLAAAVEELTRDAAKYSVNARLADLALDQIPNPEAIAFLDRLSEEAGGEYLSAGMETRISDFVPGIKVRVLGPPTIAEYTEITKARSSDPDEFWLRQLSQVTGLEPTQLDTTRRAPPPAVEPGPVAWVVEKLRRQQVGSLQRIVTTVNNALNNTSLNLLIDANDKRMLFPGDAQIENWLWAIQHSPEAAANRKLLAEVDLYKVGHHGSRNATPKSLFRLWDKGPARERRMMALMSTRDSIHGSGATAVPQDALVKALDGRMDLVRTDFLDSKIPSVTVSAPCEGAEPFTLQELNDP